MLIHALVYHFCIFADLPSSCNTYSGSYVRRRHSAKASYTGTGPHRSVTDDGRVQLGCVYIDDPKGRGGPHFPYHG